MICLGVHGEKEEVHVLLTHANFILPTAVFMLVIYSVASSLSTRTNTGGKNATVN